MAHLKKNWSKDCSQGVKRGKKEGQVCQDLNRSLTNEDELLAAGDGRRRLNPIRKPDPPDLVSGFQTDADEKSGVRSDENVGRRRRRFDDGRRCVDALLEVDLPSEADGGHSAERFQVAQRLTSGSDIG